MVDQGSLSPSGVKLLGLKTVKNLIEQRLNDSGEQQEFIQPDLG
jgi:hypothetical protein